MTSISTETKQKKKELYRTEELLEFAAGWLRWGQEMFRILIQQWLDFVGLVVGDFSRVINDKFRPYSRRRFTLKRKKGAVE